MNTPPLAHMKLWNRATWYISSLMSSGLGPVKPAGPTSRYARRVMRSPISPALMRSYSSCRAAQCRHIRPTPTLRFFSLALSARAMILRVVGPSTVTGFSMNVFTPFSMA